MSQSSKNTHFSFRPLQTINEERSTHGLRYGDYARYRKHCAHKTHRLRSSLKLTHGKGREFKQMPSIMPEETRDGHLHLLLFETERAWAHAQELSAPQDSRRSTSRYRRSHNYLSRLLNIACSPNLPYLLPAHSTVELLVYALIHTARFNLRRASTSTAVNYGLDHHSAAESAEEADSASVHPLIQLSVAFTLLSELENTAQTSKEVALARAFKDDIGPEIRWCVHEFGRGSDDDEDKDLELEKHVMRWKAREWDIEGIVADISPLYAEKAVRGFAGIIQALRTEKTDEQADGKKQILEELLWDGEPVPVRNPELVDALLKVQEATRKLATEVPYEDAGTKGKHGQSKSAKGKMAKYDGILLSLSDAVDQARKLVEAQQLSGSSSNASSGTGGRDIHFMHAYLTFLHLTYRTERDLLLLSALVSQVPAVEKRQIRPSQNTASILHLLSGILQSLSQTLTLSITDESPDLSAALSARLSYVKALRTLHLARAYAHPSHKKFAEALSLTQRGHLYIREALSTLSILPSDPSPHLRFYPLDSESLKRLEEELTKDENDFKIEWFAYNGGAIDASEQSSEKYRKPLFFDIAFNYVEPPTDKLRLRAGLPPRQDTSTGIATASAKAKPEEEERKEEIVETPAPRGGLTGFLGSWWSRK